MFCAVRSVFSAIAMRATPDSITKRSTTTAKNASTGTTMIVERMSAMPPPRFQPSDPMPEMSPPTNTNTNAMPIATSPTRKNTLARRRVMKRVKVMSKRADMNPRPMSSSSPTRRGTPVSSTPAMPGIVSGCAAAAS